MKALFERNPLAISVLLSSGKIEKTHINHKASDLPWLPGALITFMFHFEGLK